MSDDNCAPFSIVIPAHDEERVIARTLDSLGPLADEGVEVIVVANGCSDRTAQIARQYSWVITIELPEGSKSGALNAGDVVASIFPRLYADADIQVSAAALRALANELHTTEALVGSLRVEFNTVARPWVVRAFYRVFEQLPYVQRGLVGLGLYGLSRAGHCRIGSFPNVTGDDLFIQRLFSLDERRILSDHRFVVETPRTLSALLAVRTRVARGNAQLAGEGVARRDVEPSTFKRTTAVSTFALAASLLRRPANAPAVAVYLLISLLARFRSRRASGGQWERDMTTR